MDFIKKDSCWGIALGNYINTIQYYGYRRKADLSVLTQ